MRRDVGACCRGDQRLVVWKLGSGPLRATECGFARVLTRRNAEAADQAAVSVFIRSTAAPGKSCVFIDSTKRKIAEET